MPPLLVKHRPIAGAITDIATIWSIFHSERTNRQITKEPTGCRLATSFANVLWKQVRCLIWAMWGDSQLRQYCDVKWYGVYFAPKHLCDVITRALASLITGVSIVGSTACSGADQRKHQSSASLAFMRGIQKGQWRGKSFHVMTSSSCSHHDSQTSWVPSSFFWPSGAIYGDIELGQYWLR